MFSQTKFPIEKMASNYRLAEELAATFGEEYFLELGLRTYRSTGSNEVSFRTISVANLIVKDIHAEWFGKPGVRPLLEKTEWKDEWCEDSHCKKVDGDAPDCPRCWTCGRKVML